MKTTFKTFFTTKVPAFFKGIPAAIKNAPATLKKIPGAAKSAWNWIRAFVIVAFPAFIKNLCGSIKAFITPAAVAVK